NVRSSMWRSGGIGRRSRLKICRTSLCVRVQVPPPPPLIMEMKRLLVFAIWGAGLVLAQSAQQGLIHLNVDATDAPRRLIHVQLNIPASAGPMTLLYPQWIPGEHA